MVSKIAIYPGSFNPWHEGHEDILQKALKVFDSVVILQGTNTKKLIPKDKKFLSACSRYGERVTGGFFKGMLVDAINDIPSICAVIRGLRSGYDLEYEMNLQYWNEDLGLSVPVVYFITDRQYGHISSSAIREMEIYSQPEREEV